MKKNENGRRSIKSKLLVRSLLLLCVSVLTAGGLTSYYAYSGTVQTLRQTMTETVALAAELASATVENAETVALQTSRMSLITSASTSMAQYLETLKEEQQRNDYLGSGYVSLEGYDYATGRDVSAKDYFLQAKAGAVYMSEPYYDTVLGNTECVVAAPVERNGAVAAVIYFRLDASFLSDAVAGIHIGESGSAYVLGKGGLIIAHPDASRLLTAGSAGDGTELGLLEADMLLGASGMGTYTQDGVSRLLVYAPVPGTDGWSIAITAVTSEFISSTMNGLKVTAAVIAALLLVSVIILSLLAGSITRPICQCVERITALSRGDLTAPVPEIHGRDETALLTDATRVVVDTLNAVIGDISGVLGRMAQGDMTARPGEGYIGDLAPIRKAEEEIAAALGGALGRIREAASQVSSGSQQIATGAQSLALGAASQASATEELSATVAQIESHARRSNENVGLGMGYVEEMDSRLSLCSRQMAQLQTAMEGISTSSEEIGKIIRVIDDIAFQTNILALNAAVEAARAGAAGRGFSVVAQEVRTLAAKSAQAAGQTAALIERSVSGVRAGSELTERTAEALEALAHQAALVRGSIGDIRQSSQEQVGAIAQVTAGLGQISDVVQSNSATAQESAAASEELSAQAEALARLVAEFRLAEEVPSASEPDALSDAPSEPSLASLGASGPEEQADALQAPPEEAGLSAPRN